MTSVPLLNGLSGSIRSSWKSDECLEKIVSEDFKIKTICFGNFSSAIGILGDYYL